MSTREVTREVGAVGRGEAVEGGTARRRAKADRRAVLLREAARLFAQRGFAGVSIEDLGSAAGVSGPAVYRHFPSKHAVLAAVLVGVSERLAEGGRTVAETPGDAASAVRALVRFHVDFALANADVIRVQDRDMETLEEADRRAVRTLQRGYVEHWVDTLARVHPDRDRAELRLRVQATFGLINSTPHSVRTVAGGPHSVRTVARGRTAEVLTEMSLACLDVPA